MAFEYAQMGRNREALAAFDRVVALRPDWAEAHFNRGFLRQKLNDHEAALEAFDQALAHNPDHDRALYGKALSLIATKRQDDAVAPLQRNTKLQPMSPFGWYQLARVQFDRGKPDKAQSIIDHLATFEPKVAAQLARETGLRAPPRP
jgi:tetratricopeptide (TPR) repeat protein